MKRLLHILPLALSVLAVSCAPKQQEEDFAAQPFPQLKIPAMMNSLEDRVYYVVDNYWTEFTDTSRHLPCRDTTLVSGVEAAEVTQAVANYVTIIGGLPLEKVRPAMERLADRICLCEQADTSSNVLEYLSKTIEFYLWDPNSPFRDEDIYGAFAGRLAHSDVVPEAKRAVYLQDARNCSLNSRGTKAADFRFTTREGRSFSLYGIKAEHTILFFSNPGCTACKDIINTLDSDPVIKEKIASGELAVLNIYIDEQLKEWYEYMPIYPKSWYNGYDPDGLIRSDDLYNVRAIPSLYFLDKDKKVLLKDAPIEKLMNNLPWQK